MRRKWAPSQRAAIASALDFTSQGSYSVFVNFSKTYILIVSVHPCLCAVRSVSTLFSSLVSFRKRLCFSLSPYTESVGLNAVFSAASNTFANDCFCYLVVRDYLGIWRCHMTSDHHIHLHTHPADLRLSFICPFFIIIFIFTFFTLHAPQSQFLVVISPL